MKVGTDGAVLGAWADVERAKRILDIGTGTGILALMTAQRTPEAVIDAVEMDEQTAAQASENVASSPWTDRIRVHCMDARRLRASELYDLVICNPPYYPGEMSTTDASSAIAKHSAELNLQELLAIVDGLLADDGRFAVIVPANRERDLCDSSEGTGLFVARRAPLFYLENRACKRVLLEFVRQRTTMVQEQVTVEHAPGTYTEQYRALLEPFMLHF